MSAETALMTTPAHKKIVLKSCYGKTGHKLRLEPCKDAYSNQWLGVEKLSEEEKRKRSYVVQPGHYFRDGQEVPGTYLEITDGYTFDLNKEVDRINWEWAKHCPQIAVDHAATDRAIKGEKAEDFMSYEGDDKEFYVFDADAEVIGQEKRDNNVFAALSYIHDQSPSQLYQLARLLGSNMDNTSTAGVRNYLNDKARKHPDQVLKVSQDPSSKSRLFLYKALDNEVIRRRDGVYYYNQNPLGTTEDQVLLWMQEDRNYTLVRAISLELQPNTTPKAITSEANQQLFEQLHPSEPVFSNEQVNAASDAGDEPSLEDMDALAPEASPASPSQPRAQARRQAGRNN